MKKVFSIFALTVLMCAFASMAQAQATRTWVSGTGDDANPCSRTAPCKTFAGAITKTGPSGEINALDPGGFGALTITKSITIDGTGTLAGILAAGTNGIVINALTTDVITLRGLDINGFGTGVSGVRVFNNMPKAVNIEDCTIYRFAQLGVDWSTTAGTLGQLNIRNSVFKNNGGDGVGVSTTAGQVRGSFIHSSFIGNANGVHAKVNSRLSALHCDFSGNSNNGVLADGSTGVIRISISQLANNGGNGANATTGGVVSLNSCDIYANFGTGALVSGGELDTYNNNRIFANGTDGCTNCTQKTFN